MALGSTGPVENKVKAATAGSTAGVVVSGLLLWILDTYAWKADPIPDPVTAAVWALPVLLTFAGGFLGRHTARRDPDALAGAHAAAAEKLADRDARRRDPLYRRDPDLPA